MRLDGVKCDCFNRIRRRFHSFFISFTCYSRSRVRQIELFTFDDDVDRNI